MLRPGALMLALLRGKFTQQPRHSRPCFARPAAARRVAHPSRRLLTVPAAAAMVADGGGGGGRVALVWLRRDLRLSDHAPFTAAAAAAEDSGGSRTHHMLPLYCLDPAELGAGARVAGDGGLGLPRMGPHRCRSVCPSASHQPRLLGKRSALKI